MRKKTRKAQSFVIGDLHGNYKGLVQVLNKVNFNKKKDFLIFLGDLADGYPEPEKCLELLMSIENFIPIMGNHDLFLKKWITKNEIDKRWYKIGADETIFLFKNHKALLHQYLKKTHPYFIWKNMVFCHGGFNHKRPLEKQKKLTFSINRRLYKTACVYDKQKIKFKIKKHEKSEEYLDYIFIGHTPTKNDLPDFKSNLINLDTGSGNGGCLTIMNLGNFKYCQATKSKLLYK